MQPQFPALSYYLIHWLVSALALLITAKLMPRFIVKSFGDAMIAAVVIGIANAVVWPILIVLTLPINILTLGFFTFAVNGAVLKICAAILKGFEIDGWLPAIMGSIVLSIVGAVLRFFVF
ncbi:MAG: phage holin family protein [Bdellovibrionales bacterium]|nr:phage holin family protein [Bdellovibrionales bacterium]